MRLFLRGSLFYIFLIRVKTNIIRIGKKTAINSNYFPLKYLLILLFTFLVSSESDDETVTWDASKKLTWADFKGSPDLESDAVALTASGITFGYSVKTSGDRIAQFSTTVETHFYPNKSWYLKAKSNEHILSHEQLHFDITELYARMFREQISKIEVNQNVKKQLNRLHDLINVAVSETQKKYDKETQHSINAVKQREWNNFIEKELDKYDQFKSE